MKKSTILTATLIAILCVTNPVSAGIYSGGAGTAAEPYLIANATDWQELMIIDRDWVGHFELTAHLDLAGVILTPVGNLTTKFTGTFDGAGYTIYNAAMDLPDENHIGLFGYTGPSAVIRNVRLENAEIMGKHWVGGLVGYTTGTTLENIGVHGTVTGVAYVGTMAGSMTGAANTMTRCSASGTVTGSRYVGGLVGLLWGATLENSYSQAAVIGVEDALGGNHEDLGGLIGWTSQTTGSTNTVNACYAAGPITVVPGTPDVGGLVGLYEGGVFTNCFWDTQASGQSASPVGIGKTTPRMKRSSTFTAAGWDFVNVWADGQQQTYPYLRLRPAADIDGDGRVILEDIAILAAQWLSGTPTLVDDEGIEWVTINDPGFVGQMSKYETTNAQFAQYLNDALASGDITISGNDIIGANGSNAGQDFDNQNYYLLNGPGLSNDGATAGGASRINWSDGVFTVDAGFENHPVTYVSWYGAMAFAHFYGWRLPTESEWQAVADFEGSYVYGCGTTISHSKANYAGSTHPHGTTEAGAMGTYGYGMADMAGNVWEWVSSFSGSSRNLRSGSWYSPDSKCAVTGKDSNWANSRNYYYGFRVCRDLTPEPAIIWVAVDDPGVSGYEAFSGEISRYETTNAQYCQFLNAALASGDVTVNGSYVTGSSGSNAGTDFEAQHYYLLNGGGYSYNGAVSGGAARIKWTGSAFTVDTGFENHPVTYVSWYGATAFANYYGWRLPTEWEWQAVADYDGTFTYGCGATISNSIANYAGSTHPHGTTPVGHFGVFGYGLSDMSGNSFEWTSSIGTSGSGSRTVRGGSWQYNVSNCAVTYRYNYGQDYTNHHVGFRVCR